MVIFFEVVVWKNVSNVLTETQWNLSLCERENTGNASNNYDLPHPETSRGYQGVGWNIHKYGHRGKNLQFSLFYKQGKTGT